MGYEGYKSEHPTVNGPQYILPLGDVPASFALGVPQPIIDTLLLEQEIDHVRAAQRCREMQRGGPRAGWVHAVRRDGSVGEEKGDGVDRGAAHGEMECCCAGVNVSFGGLAFIFRDFGEERVDQGGFAWKLGVSFCLQSCQRAHYRCEEQIAASLDIELRLHLKIHCE